MSPGANLCWLLSSSLLSPMGTAASGDRSPDTKGGLLNEKLWCVLKGWRPAFGFSWLYEGGGRQKQPRKPWERTDPWCSWGCATRKLQPRAPPWHSDGQVCLEFGKGWKCTEGANTKWWHYNRETTCSGCCFMVCVTWNRNSVVPLHCGL